MRILIVANPISGGKEKQPILSYIEEKCNLFGHPLKIFETSGHDDKNHIRELIDKFVPERIVAIGGDGTILLSAVSTLDRDIPIGIIPMGSANGLAKELNIDKDPKIAFDNFLKSDLVAKLDLLCANGKHYFIHLGDVGLNAQIVDGFEGEESRGMLAYSKYVIKVLSESEAFGYKVFGEADEIISGRAVMIGFGNGRKFGTGIPLTKKGNPFDGKFEVVIIKDVSTKSLLKRGLSVFDEVFIDDENSEEICLEYAKIKLDRSVNLQLDGELIGPVEEIEIRVHPGKVPLITNQENPYIS